MKRQERSFVEAVGRAATADGLPRIAGRLFGFLLLQPGPVTLDALAEALGVSKASVSIDARLLLSHGWLAHTTVRGDRRDYYAMAPDFFARIFAYRVDRWSAFRALIARSEFRDQDLPPEVVERLAYLTRAQAFFTRGMQQLLSEWEAEMANTGGDEPA